MCTALVHLLCGDFKLGSPVVVAAFGAAWIVRVQSGATRSRGRSRCHGRASFERSIEEAMRPTTPATPCGTGTHQLRLTVRSRHETAEWRARTSSDTADVLCAVLGGWQGPATLWQEKFSVLRNSLVLCIAVLDQCFRDVHVGQRRPPRGSLLMPTARPSDLSNSSAQPSQQ